MTNSIEPATKLQTINFHEHTVALIEHNGEPWLTATDLGNCLGYNPANARQGCLNLFNRHADEFTEEDTGVIKLMTPGGMQETRIFSRTGCNLISFFASTKRAKAFRLWAKRTLVEANKPRQATVQLLAQTQAELLRHAPLWRDIKHYKTLGLNHGEIGKLVNRTNDTVRHHVRRMEACGILTAPKSLPRQQQTAFDFLPHFQGGSHA